VEGTPDFELGFVYERYGLRYTYFNIQPYGMKLIARTYESVSESWEDISKLLGRLRSFHDMAFSYAIEEIYRDSFGVTVPEGAFFLAVDDVPEVNGWQVGAVIFVVLLSGVMIYFFYFFKWPRSPLAARGEATDPDNDASGPAR
jgi:hypothetical protein